MPTINATLNIRKSVDGNLIIRDHPDMDIVILVKESKVVSFLKKNLTDEIYEAQNNLFNFLRRSGTIVPDSVQGGNVFGSIEATIPGGEAKKPVHFLTVAVSSFFDEYLPGRKMTDDLIQRRKKDITDPPVDKTTQLGEIPHSTERGYLNQRHTSYGVPFRTFEE